MPDDHSSYRSANSSSQLTGSGRSAFLHREAVDLAELLAEVTEIRAGVHPAARDPLQHLLRVVLAPVAMEVLAEPAGQLAELALLELGVEVGDRGAQLVPE